MNTTTKIINSIIEDLCFTPNQVMTTTYQRYYESLNSEESKKVVTEALREMVKEGNVAAELGEDEFTVRLISE